VSLPGADAEANSNVLRARAPHADPLVVLAEDAVREARPAAAAAPAEETGTAAQTPADETDTADEAAPAGEAHPETTMELLVPAQERAGETPDEPARQRPEQTPEQAAPVAAAAHSETEAEHQRAEDDDEVTDKGLPKRTPKITEPAPQQRPHNASLDADALRRRLGGFRRGAEAGHRDVRAEIAEQTGEATPPAASRTGSATTEEATGGPVEEASS
ncbi:histidine kinase, partial [Streptomyces sp. NPDC096080]